MYRKLLLILLVSFFISCEDKIKKSNKDIIDNECASIKNIVSNCLGLHEGALDYIKSCGNIKLEEISNIKECKEILDFIENK